MTDINIDQIMRDLAQYQRIADETSAIIDGLKDTIKRYMSENDIEILSGTEHKATYKTVVSNRIDTTALKKACPDIAKQYSRETSHKQFRFI